MQKIFVEIVDDDSRRRKSGAAVLLIGLGLLFFAGWKSEPRVVTETVTVTQTVAVSQTTSTTSTTSTQPPPPTPPQLTVNRTELRFTQAVVQLVRLTNLGDEPLTVARPAGGNASFPLSSDCSAPLAKNASCAIAVAFDPAVTGSSRGTIRINSNGGTATIALVGEARPLPAIELQPIDFGKRLVGSSGETHTLRLSNSGAAPLAVRAAMTHSPFNVVRDGCEGMRLAAGGGCDVVVDFDPTAAGPQRDELRIDSPSGALIAHSALSGYAYVEVPVKLVLTPPQVDIPALERRRVQTIAVSNPGPRTAVIRDVKLVPNDGTFRIKDTCSGKTLAPNAPPCRIDVILAGPVLHGAAIRKVVVTYDGGSESADVIVHEQRPQVR